MRVGFLAAAVAGLLAAQSASAGVFTDDLSRCLVVSATQADKDALVRWIFAEVTLNPLLVSFSTVTEGQRTDLKRQAVAVLERLTFQNCRAQAVTAIKNEGGDALKGGFETLGNIAGRGMMSDPKVSADLGAGLVPMMNKPEWQKLGQEAGLAPSDMFGGAPAKSK